MAPAVDVASRHIWGLYTNALDTLWNDYCPARTSLTVGVFRLYYMQCLDVIFLMQCMTDPCLTFPHIRAPQTGKWQQQHSGEFGKKIRPVEEEKGV